MRTYKVKVKHHTTTETIRVDARSLDDSLTQAIEEMEDRGVRFGQIISMTSEEA